MGNYYSQRLCADRLRLCYEIAPPRIRRYLRCEIEHVLTRPNGCGHVLELGCGYGRVLEALAGKARALVGIDTSLDSLRMARDHLARTARCHLVRMDAVRLAFVDGRFDMVVCIQNGISAFQVDQATLIAEAVRVTRPGGTVVFSSYAESFWEIRLEWFRLQARRGLVGEVDEAATGEGVIVCKDGFRATTVDAEQFAKLACLQGLTPSIREVDGSSLFCELTPGTSRGRR